MNKDNIVKSFSIRTLILVTGTMLANGVVFLSAPLFCHIMSASDYGIFSVFLSWVSILAIIFGGQTHGVLNNAKTFFTQEKYADICYHACLLSVISSVIMSILLIIIFPVVQDIFQIPRECVLLLEMSAFGLYMVDFALAYFSVEKKAIHSFVLSFSVVLLVIGLSVLGIITLPFPSYIGRMSGYTTGYFCVGLGIAACFLFPLKKCSLECFKYCFGFSGPIVFHNLSEIVLSLSDRIMLAFFLGDDVAGIYSFCYALAMPILVVVDSLNLSWRPEYYRLKRENCLKELSFYFRKQIVIITGVCCCYVLVVNEMVTFLAPAVYWKGSTIIPIVVLGYFFHFLYFFPSNHEFYWGKTKIIAISTVIAAILNVGLNYVMIPRYGINGAAFATLIAYVALYFVHEVVAKFIIKDYESCFNYAMGATIVLLLFCMLSYVLVDMRLIRFCLAIFGGVYICIYAKNKKYKESQDEI